MLRGLFDVNTIIRMRADTRRPDPEGLLAAMDAAGIAQALACYEAAREGDTRDNNRELSVALREHPRLAPCWVLNPTVLYPSPAEVVREAVELGVGAMRWFVYRHEIPLDDPLIDRWMGRLEQANMVLLIDWGAQHLAEDAVDWETLTRLVSAHPRLPVILLGRDMRDTIPLYTMWEQVRNLYADTSCYQTSDGITDACQRYGPERLLFGSGLPDAEPFCPIAMLDAAAVPEATRHAIAGDTLRRLLNVSLPGADIEVSPPFPDYPVIDTHGYLGMPRAVYSGTPSADLLVAEMDRCGVQWIALSSVAALQEDDPLDGHELLAEAMAAYPDRIRGYATYNPAYHDPAMEVRRCLDGFSMLGISIHPAFAELPFDNAAWQPAFHLASEYGRPLLVLGEAPIEQARRICLEFPRLMMILSGLGGGAGREAYDALGVAESLPNLYLDTAHASAERGALEALVKGWGPERLLFASNAGYHDVAFQLGRVLGANITAGAKRAILHDNAVQLFGDIAR